MLRSKMFHLQLDRVHSIKIQALRLSFIHTLAPRSFYLNLCSSQLLAQSLLAVVARQPTTLAVLIEVVTVTPLPPLRLALPKALMAAAPCPPAAAWPLSLAVIMKAKLLKLPRSQPVFEPCLPGIFSIFFILDSSSVLCPPQIVASAVLYSVFLAGMTSSNSPLNVPR